MTEIHSREKCESVRDKGMEGFMLRDLCVKKVMLFVRRRVSPLDRSPSLGVAAGAGCSPSLPRV